MPDTHHNAQRQVPSSPPPPFRSRASSIGSRRHGSHHSPEPVDQTLEDTFDAGPNADDEHNALEDDRQRLIHDAAVAHDQIQGTRPGVSRNITVLPSFFTSNRSRQTGPSAMSNDGVFANLSAKPEKGEKLEEQPPVSPFPPLPQHLILRSNSNITSHTNKQQLMLLLRTGRRR